MALLLSLGAKLVPAARDREKALGRVHVGSRGLVGGRERNLEGHAAALERADAARLGTLGERPFDLA